MAILGTKKFWLPAKGLTNSQKGNQILKNTGYINLQLYSVNYMSKGNFWQNTFGGKDKVALSSTLNYQSGLTNIEATSVQDISTVKANKNYNLGKQRNIAIKIPANADAISFDVKMTAIKNDQLQAKFDMLNSSDYQSALELAPKIIGQVLTVTSLVKKLFSDSDPNNVLEASYAGVISLEAENNPVSNGKLTRGFLIMLSTNDGEQFDDVEVANFEINGDSLIYNNKLVENTYAIFNVSFESFRGEDERSNWSKKYVEALNNLDKIFLTEDSHEIEKIYLDSKKLWVDGNALLDADDRYINSEKMKIKMAKKSSLNNKYNTLIVEIEIAEVVLASDDLISLTGSASLDIIKESLPETGNFLFQNINKDRILKTDELSTFILSNDDLILSEHLKLDVTNYLDELKKNNISFIQ